MLTMMDARVIELPPGDTYLKRPMEIPKGAAHLTIRGNPRGSTLVMGSDFQGSAAIILDGVSDADVSGFEVRGNRAELKSDWYLPLKEAAFADYYSGNGIVVRGSKRVRIRKVGFQTTSVVRLMQLSRDLRLPLAPQVLSRLLRHLYGVEIHWDARILPGVSIVHGVGLVIGHGAEVGEGCILFHNVTLGEGIDPETRAVGAPRLGRDVHVGPGATLLGPIHVGDGTKIMAGSILTQSVPPRSVVRPPAATVDVRPAPTALAGLAVVAAAKPTRKPRS